MKIAFCLHHFLPDYIAGTEIYVFNLAVHLQREGAETVVIIPNLGQDDTDEYYYKGIRVIKYAENSIEDRAMIMGKTKPAGLELFTSIIKKEKPGIVHFHELAPGKGLNIFHVEAVYALKIPIVLSFHLSVYTCMKGSLVYMDTEKCDGEIRIRRCTDCVYHSKNMKGVKAQLLLSVSMAFFHKGINAVGLNNSIGTALGFPFVIGKIKTDLQRLSVFAEKIVVLAEWYKNILEKNQVPPEKIVCIKQGLTNENAYIPTVETTGPPLKVVFLGRISALKGLHLLIDAVNQLPAEKIILTIYGQEAGDNYAAECKRKTMGKGNILWKGTIDSDRVVPALSTQHLLCLPSTFSEMSPLVIQEAFAAGIPVLASDVYGNAEQIQDGVNGWLFDFNNSTSLAEKLRLLFNDLSLIEKAKHQLPVPGHFKDIASKHFKIYQEIVNEDLINR